MVVYGAPVFLLVSKVGEVLGGVFDTSVPAYPLAGMFFVLVFVSFRRKELERLLADQSRDWATTLAGVVIAFAPFAIQLTLGTQVDASYSYAGLAVVCSFFGILTAIRPSLFRFLAPYFMLYALAVGFVGALTASFGDPLAVVVAVISSGFTRALGEPVQWSSVYITFTGAGGQAVNLEISQECSGIASMSIFLLILGMMHLDMNSSVTKSAFFAFGGSALFVLLNSLRVVGLVTAGIYSGTNLMWNLHGWLGYVLYIVGYTLLLFLYLGAKKVPGRSRNATEAGTLVGQGLGNGQEDKRGLDPLESREGLDDD